MLFWKYVSGLLGFFPSLFGEGKICCNFEQYIIDRIFLLNSFCTFYRCVNFYFFHLTKSFNLCWLSYYQHNACLISIEKDSRKVNIVEAGQGSGGDVNSRNPCRGMAREGLLTGGICRAS